jgi:hypothetical protein
MKKIILCALMAFSFSVSAEISCSGKVTEIMDHSTLSYCDGHLAYRLVSTGNTYLCAISERSDSMVLAAYMADKTISARLATTPSENECKSYTSNYISPLYIKIITD